MSDAPTPLERVKWKLDEAMVNLKGEKPWESAWLVTCGRRALEEALEAWDELERNYHLRAPKPTPAEPMERFTKVATEITKMRDTVRNIALDEEACGYKEHPLHKFHLDFAVSMTRWIAMLTPEPGKVWTSQGPGKHPTEEAYPPVTPEPGTWEEFVAEMRKGVPGAWVTGDIEIMVNYALVAWADRIAALFASKDAEIARLKEEVRKAEIMISRYRWPDTTGG